MTSIAGQTSFVLDFRLNESKARLLISFTIIIMYRILSYAVQKNDYGVEKLFKFVIGTIHGSGPRIQFNTQKELHDEMRGKESIVSKRIIPGMIPS